LIKSLRATMPTTQRQEGSSTAGKRSSPGRASRIAIATARQVSFGKANLGGSSRSKSPTVMQ
jgi:hypothetical protein